MKIYTDDCSSEWTIKEPRIAWSVANAIPTESDSAEEGASTLRARSLVVTNALSAGESLPIAKKHKCPYCSTDFIHHDNLQSHLLAHSQEKPYCCQICNARFPRPHDLERHTNLHTREGPHICIKCGHRFSTINVLISHIMTQGSCAGRRASTGDKYGGCYASGVDWKHGAGTATDWSGGTATQWSGDTVEQWSGDTVAEWSGDPVAEWSGERWSGEPSEIGKA